jgi:hypothetical protein
MSVSIGRMINLGALAFISTALMQAAQQGTFHLPVTAHWGQVVLEPGDYRMAFPSPSAGQMEFLVQGPHKTVYELPLVTDVQNISSRSYFKLDAINGDYFIRELSFGPGGKIFTFSLPKTGHREHVAKVEISSLDAAGN